MADFEKYKESFSQPNRRYAVYPIIHSSLSGDTDFDYYERCGFAGVVGNVRYQKPEFPFVEADWKRAEAGFRGFAARGMHTWLYDEDGYPSGTAGGYITETHPEYIAKGLYCFDYWRTISGPCTYRSDVPDGKLYRALLIPCTGDEDPIDVTHSQNGNGVLYIPVPEGSYHLLVMCIRRLFDGTHASESYSEPRNYISLSDKEATRAFLAVTHEKYKELLADEFGKSILATFTDEPSLISWNIRGAIFPILPYHDKYPSEFEKKYGYDFAYACAAVVMRLGREQVKRRCDFWEYIANTVADGYFKTIRDFCHENGLKSSGHMLKEEKLQAHVYNYGSFYRSMKQMDWPGIDQLDTQPEKLMNPNQIPIARFIASFADISGERESFTEFSDHSYRSEKGSPAPIEYYYKSVNWHLAMGINNFTSYYSWAGLTDEQKLTFNTYTARAGYLLREGVRDSRVAVFYPEAAMWESFKPKSGAPWWENGKPIPRTDGIDHTERTLALDRAFEVASWGLVHRQVDFDYIDAEILREGKIIEHLLGYNGRAYEAVVVPCARVLEDAAAKKLLMLADAGIPVLFCGECVSLSRETGEASPYAKQIAQRISDGKGMHFAPSDSFDALLDTHLPVSCRPVLTEKPEEMLLSHTRVTSEGERIVYLANMAEEDFHGKIKIDITPSCVMLADCHAGVFSPLPYKTEGERTTVTVSVASGEGKFILLK